ncbi:MAG: hypothetical protein A2Z14_17300 [Chloroflexi bacterium RBG_16_48_8]|nr:MAG: hypothetical protein A2Z14_17300 [Chloroflexi bacterium RBG_16_48_8]
MYDDAGRIVEVMENYVEGKTIAEDSTYNIFTKFWYDEVGNLELLIDTLGKVTYFEYDNANRLVLVTINYVPAYKPDSEFNVTTQFRYDDIGNQIAFIDPLGTITRTYYDALNQPITVVENLSDWEFDNPNPPPFDPTSPDRNVPTWYSYDAVGNLTYIEDALGTMTCTCYNVRNLPHKSITNPTVPNPCQPYTGNGLSDLDIINQWSYDSVGNILSWTDPRASTTAYGYDDLNRLETLTNPLGYVTTFEYDALGNLTFMKDTQGVVTHYDYDELSRLSHVIQNFITGAPQDP